MAGLRELLADKIKARQFFEKMVPMSYFMGDHVDRLVVCPFHPDNAPSAKMYDESDGTQRLYCFGCRKQFSSYDYCVQVAGRNPAEYLLSVFGKEDLELLSASFVPVKLDVREVDADLGEATKLLPDVSGFFNNLFYSVKAG